MDLLPHEVLFHILSRLPLISLLQSKLVCRAWRNVIQDPLLISDHFSHMSRLTDSDPSFLVQSDERLSDQLHFIDFSSHSESGKVIFNKLPNLSTRTYVVDSCNGLVCMHNHSQSIYICNPFTRLCIELPNLKGSAQMGLLGFGFDPISKQYKVIRIVFRPSLIGLNLIGPPLDRSLVKILTVGSPTWRSLGMIPYRLARPTSNVKVNGRLHWLSKSDSHTIASLIVSFDLATEQFQEVSKPDCCNSDGCFHQLMVLQGCLSAGAYHGNEELEIWVMKQYGVKESWVKKFNIATYFPRSFNSFVRVHCLLRSGEILVEYNSKALVLYNSEDGTFKELTFPDLPKWFRLIVHVGSLNWVDTPVKF